MQNLSSWPPRAPAELQGGSEEGGCFSRCGFTSRSTPQHHFHPMLCSLCRHQNPRPIPSSQELVRFWGCSLLAPSASKDLSLVHITLKQQQPVGNPEVEYLPPIRSETRSLLASSAPWCSRECLRSIQPSFAKKLSINKDSTAAKSPAARIRGWSGLGCPLPAPEPGSRWGCAPC